MSLYSHFVSSNWRIYAISSLPVASKYTVTIPSNFFWVEKKNQLDATEGFIALIICSTCFGHFYAHHQELETICVLIPPMVCNALVAGGRRSVQGSRLCVRNEGCCSSNIPRSGRILTIHSADKHRKIHSFSKTTSYSTFYAFFSSFRITLRPIWLANSKR